VHVPYKGISLAVPAVMAGEVQLTFAGIATAAATATNSSGTVTVSWPAGNMLVSNDMAAQFVTQELAALTTLTSPITVSHSTQRWLTS